MRKFVALAMSASLALASCAHSYQPIIDTQGVDPAKYQADLAQCRAFADQVNPAGNAVAGAVLAAMFGAALGAATGSFYGNAGAGAALGASAGGITGAAAGGAGGASEQIKIINKCLEHRGYAVLN